MSHPSDPEDQQIPLQYNGFYPETRERITRITCLLIPVGPEDLSVLSFNRETILPLEFPNPTRVLVPPTSTPTT
ncbi:hypothetical protein MUP05_00930 [Candidatus Bathyarchaeota archaeon]|nr:hypothetical protein [Candidatus Bathyarchaeota archaeon]